MYNGAKTTIHILGYLYIVTPLLMTDSNDLTTPDLPKSAVHRYVL